MNTVRKWNEVLRCERELHGWSQAELADKVGTDQKVVSRWERGISHPSPYFRKKLIELLGKNAAELGFVVPSDMPVMFRVDNDMQPTVFCKRKVDQFTNEKCTIYRTEQNDITNEKCATLQVKSAPGLLFLQSSSVSSSWTASGRT